MFHIRQADLQGKKNRLIFVIYQWNFQSKFIQTLFSPYFSNQTTLVAIVPTTNKPYYLIKKMNNKVIRFGFW
jgi:hypothetical protein